MGMYCILLGLFAVVFHLMLDNEKLLKNEMELNSKLAERDETIHLLENLMAKADEELAKADKELKMKNATIFELKALKMELEKELRTKNEIITELVKNCTQVDMYRSWRELFISIAKDLGIKIIDKLGEILTQEAINFFNRILGEERQIDTT